MMKKSIELYCRRSAISTALNFRGSVLSPVIAQFGSRLKCKVKVCIVGGSLNRRALGMWLDEGVWARREILLAVVMIVSELNELFNPKLDCSSHTF
jgi:hypothetical protein